MTPPELKAWRKAERERLIGERERLDHATLERWRRRIDSHLERSFPGLATAKLAFCWPMRGDSRSSSGNGIPGWRSPPGLSVSPIRPAPIS